MLRLLLPVMTVVTMWPAVGPAQLIPCTADSPERRGEPGCTIVSDKRLPGPLLAPEHTVVVSNDAVRARALGREFVNDPYLGRRNYVNNLLRHGFTPDDVANRGSDRLIDALVLHGTPDTIADGLSAHLHAGANHVGIQVLAPAGQDPMLGLRALATVLF